mmetsp:Transcript_26805/g.42556  ORF Transcript_26805/g.42556 Transcript_26805/m.42556 type:complete len:577 (-) Transcript_26805:949-2679(-)
MRFSSLGFAASSFSDFFGESTGAVSTLSRISEDFFSDFFGGSTGAVSTLNRKRKDLCCSFEGNFGFKSLEFVTTDPFFSLERFGDLLKIFFTFFSVLNAPIVENLFSVTLFTSFDSCAFLPFISPVFSPLCPTQSVATSAPKTFLAFSLKSIGSMLALLSSESPVGFLTILLERVSVATSAPNILLAFSLKNIVSMLALSLSAFVAGFLTVRLEILQSVLVFSRDSELLSLSSSFCGTTFSALSLSSVGFLTCPGSASGLGGFGDSARSFEKSLTFLLGPTTSTGTRSLFSTSSLVLVFGSFMLPDVFSSFSLGKAVSALIESRLVRFLLGEFPSSSSLCSSASSLSFLHISKPSIDSRVSPRPKSSFSVADLDNPLRPECPRARALDPVGVEECPWPGDAERESDEGRTGLVLSPSVSIFPKLMLALLFRASLVGFVLADEFLLTSISLEDDILRFPRFICSEEPASLRSDIPSLKMLSLRDSRNGGSGVSSSGRSLVIFIVGSSLSDVMNVLFLGFSFFSLGSVSCGNIEACVNFFTFLCRPDLCLGDLDVSLFRNPGDFDDLRLLISLAFDAR